MLVSHPVGLENQWIFIVNPVSNEIKHAFIDVSPECDCCFSHVGYRERGKLVFLHDAPIRPLFFEGVSFDGDKLPDF